MPSAEPLPVVDLARHGETAWSLTGQHTGRTDLPLTARGEANAAALGRILAGRRFVQIRTSPSLRARATCELAGFGSVAVVDPDLAEWDYGEYEGLRSEEIEAFRPGWQLFRDGCPGGESPAEVAARADRVVARIHAEAGAGGGDILLFTSGHLLRVAAARWLGVDPAGDPWSRFWGRSMVLSTASVSQLGYGRDRSDPILRLWNDTRHVGQ
jgi:probable phosphoglycerate mutase